MNAKTDGTSAAARSPIGRERVVRTGIQLADESGIESLSMRKLAGHLGIEAMSLYHYVRNKDELLGAMLDAIYREMEFPPSSADWRSDLRTAAVSARDVLLRHPWAPSLLMSPTAPSAARLEWMNAVLGRLREAGFSPGMTHHAYHALDSHIIGFVLWVLPALALADRPELARAVIERMPLERLPHLAEHIQQHVADEPGDVSEFEFGLELVLEGLERRRTTG